MNKTSNVTIDGVSYRWKRDPIARGRSAIGLHPNKRGWTLAGPDGLIAQLTHTQYQTTYGREVAPEWVISLRFLATPEEQHSSGTFKDMTLKARVPSPDGAEGTHAAQQLAEQAWKRINDKRKTEQAAKTAATYVQISRDDLEGWLDTIPHLHGKWERQSNRAGVYLLPLSDSVAVKLSSTIGTSDDAMGRGMASMQLSLISSVTGQVLNKKAQGQGHFKRTTNWRRTWAEGIERMREAYIKSQGFYEAIAVIKDRAAYQKDLLERIERVSEWKTHQILSDFHNTVERGGVLTAKQLELLDKLVAVKSEVQKPSTEEDSRIGMLRSLYAEARRQSNEWAMGFAKSVADQIKAGRQLSPKQTEMIQKLRLQFGI